MRMSLAPQALQFFSKPPNSVLVIKPSSLGDVVHTLPAVAALKKHWPQARFRWLVNPEWAPLLEGNPDLDQIHLFPRAKFRGWLGPARLWAWAREFGATGAADLVLDFQGLLRSALIGHFCRRGPFVGLSDAREGAGWFYDAAAPVQATQHAVDRYLSLARWVGAPIPERLEWRLPRVPFPAGFEENPPYVLVHPFSRGAGKSLEPQEMAELCEALRPLRVVVAGRVSGGEEREWGGENWLNRTSLLEMIALLRGAAWVVSVDSGPMHLAAALGVPLVSIHTWSDPDRVGPYPPGAWVFRKCAGRLQQRGSLETPRPLSGFRALGAWVKARMLGEGNP
jgi:heptosyltransferase-1